MIVVAITGGRDYRVTPKDLFWLGEQSVHLSRNLMKLSEMIFIHGDAKGVDRDVGWLLESKGFSMEKYPAEWEKYGKSAGPIRNAQMAEKCQVLLAFPGGTGTQNMIETCIHLGKEVRYSPTREQT